MHTNTGNSYQQPLHRCTIALSLVHNKNGQLPDNSRITMKEIVEVLKKVAKENPDGFTFDIRSMRNVEHGIAVAHEATQNTFGFANFPTVVAHAIANNGVVGGWRGKRKYYLDSVRLFHASELHAAIAFGKANKQISIYHLSEKRLIFI